MITDILLADMIPQIILVMLTGIYLLSGLKRGLQPLHTLAKHIAARSSGDLSPIPETHVFVEVRALADTINDVLEQLTQAIATQQRFIANAASITHTAGRIEIAGGARITRTGHAGHEAGAGTNPELRRPHVAFNLAITGIGAIGTDKRRL